MSLSKGKASREGLSFKMRVENVMGNGLGAPVSPAVDAASFIGRKSDTNSGLHSIYIAKSRVSPHFGALYVFIGRYEKKRGKHLYRKSLSFM